VLFRADPILLVINRVGPNKPLVCARPRCLEVDSGRPRGREALPDARTGRS
jgi:hypothetical protein